MTPKRRTIKPEEEDRRADRGTPKRGHARDAGVESLADGEDAAEREAEKPRDD
jgi:hypothetical protein